MAGVKWKDSVKAVPAIRSRHKNRPNCLEECRPTMRLR